MTFAIVCSDLTFAWPGGAPVLTGLNLAIGPGRTGLLGVNGSGKSTLLRILAGELRPHSGSVTLSGDVGYLPQNLPLRVGATVSDLLGITATREALHAIERGDVSAEAFTAVGEDWDVEERAHSELHRLGLGGLGLDDVLAALSGGEAALVALAALLLAQPPPQLLLLDEPTNTLDMASARQLAQALDAYRGALIVASHDLPFLRSIGVTRWLHLDRATGLTEGEPDRGREFPAGLDRASQDQAS